MTQKAKPACSCKCKLSSFAKFALGAVVFFLGVILTIGNLHLLKMFLTAAGGPFLILAGLVLMAIAKE